MGLDQRLIVMEYVNGWPHAGLAEKTQYEAITTALGFEPTPDSPGIIVNVPVIYWRKAYWLQDHFESLLGGVENGQYHYVMRESLQELLGILDDCIDNPVKAKARFGTNRGWFDPSDSDEEYKWFFEELKRSYEELRKVLADERFESSGFYYEADW